MSTQKHIQPLLELKTVYQVPPGSQFSLRMAGLTSNYMNTLKTPKTLLDFTYNFW